ncbi:MAG: hypothetical protein ACP5IZ_11855, partial [Thermoprotei archaeon]
MNCPSCNIPLSHIYDELVCRKCGLVVGPTYENIEYRNVHHSPDNVILGTDIDIRKAKNFAEAQRLRTLNNRIHRNEARRIQIINEINGITSRLGLPKIVEKEAVRYAMKIKTTNHEKTALAGAFVLAASRNLGYYISETDILKNANINIDDLRRSIKLLYEKSIIKHNNHTTMLVNQVINKLGLNWTVREKALKIMNSKRWDGYKPSTIVATIIYLACTQSGIHVKTKDIAKTLNISPN